MKRRPSLKMIDVYPHTERESVIVTIPHGEERVGTWHGDISARLLDQDTRGWFFELGSNAEPRRD